MRTINWGESAKPWEGREQDCGRLEEQTKNGLRSRGSGLEGGMKVSVEDGMILEHHNVSSFSASHVLWELRRLAKLEHPPKEKIVLWY